MLIEKDEELERIRANKAETQRNSQHPSPGKGGEFS